MRSLWVLSVLLIMLPGLCYVLWQMDVLDRDQLHNPIPMFSYFAGNLGGLVFIAAAIWKTTWGRTENTDTVLFVAGAIGIIAIGVAGLVGMNNFMLEFIVG